MRLNNHIIVMGLTQRFPLHAIRVQLGSKTFRVEVCDLSEDFPVFSFKTDSTVDWFLLQSFDLCYFSCLGFPASVVVIVLITVIKTFRGRRNRTEPTNRPNILRNCELPLVYMENGGLLTETRQPSLAQSGIKSKKLKKQAAELNKSTIHRHVKFSAPLQVHSSC